MSKLPLVRSLRVASLLAAGGLLLAACGGSSGTNAGSGGGAQASASSPSATGAVLATAHTSLGAILVDGQGKTVYLFAADSPDKSNCSGSCLQYWPAVTAPATLPASVPGVSAKLGQITRSDGTKQLTVNGWPVYTYKGDSAPGMTSGQGTNLSGGLWWVLSPAGVAIKSMGGSSSPSPSASKSSSGGGGWA